MSSLSTRRHSLSHIMAQATRMVMGANVKLAIGPDVDTGWYYDMDFLDGGISEDKLHEIEKKMHAIIRENQEFRQFSLSVEDARTFLTTLGESYKVEMVSDLAEKGETTISFFANIGKFQNPAYASFDFLGNPETRAVTRDGEILVPQEEKNPQSAHTDSSSAKEPNKEPSGFDFRGATFIDMCQGPHILSTGEIPEWSYSLDKLAGAYWRGDAKNKQLTRIYGLAFETREELERYKTMMEEAKKRDHRILGKKLKIFTISELVWSGLPLLQPNGMIMRREIEDYLWSLHRDKWYLRVWTPHIAKEHLYETSGHAAKFGDELFRVNGKEEKFILKPMNCPHHMQIFADNQFSYRDMPIRYFEPATVYRDEKTGQLSGLTRVRAITQDDGHLFCRVTQIKDEVKTIVWIIKEFYATMGMIDGYWVSLSVRDPLTPEKYLWGDDVWKIAEWSLEEAAQENELNYKRMEGEAAFYGPKLDFMFRDAIGRQWQLATIQCDFNLPNRFELKFINEKWEEERPVVIHRAISGSLERFMGVMIEHFAGVFPLWLAPQQGVVIPVGEKFESYAREVCDSLRKANIRVTLDDSSDWLGKKIRNAETDHVNYILVVGEKEVAEKTVSVRNYKTKEQSTESLESFIERITEEITERRL